MATQEELKAAFEIVENQDHWKGKINTWVPETADIDLISEAIIHFTATVPTITPKAKVINKKSVKGYKVVAAGYWGGPAC